MPEWIEKRIMKIEYAFREFPKLKWLSIFYIFLMLAVVLVYQPLLVGLYKFNIMGMHIFQDFIQENLDLLLWGNFIIPIVIAIWGYSDVVSLYEEKYVKRYGQLPKWVD